MLNKWSHTLFYECSIQGGQVKMEAFENSDEKSVIYHLFPSAFLAFLVWMIRYQKYAFSNENKEVWTSEKTKTKMQVN